MGYLPPALRALVAREHQISPRCIRYSEHPALISTHELIPILNWAPLQTPSPSSFEGTKSYILWLERRYEATSRRRCFLRVGNMKVDSWYSMHVLERSPPSQKPRSRFGRQKTRHNASGPMEKHVRRLDALPIMDMIIRTPLPVSRLI
jgi:hypothetical protein